MFAFFSLPSLPEHTLNSWDEGPGAWGRTFGTENTSPSGLVQTLSQGWRRCCGREQRGWQPSAGLPSGLEGRTSEHRVLGHTGPTSPPARYTPLQGSLVFLARLDSSSTPHFPEQQCSPCPGRVVSPESSLCPPLPHQIHLYWGQPSLRTTSQMYPRPLLQPVRVTQCSLLHS